MEITNQVVAALLVAAILWAVGLPGTAARRIFGAINGLKMRRRIASGLFDQNTLSLATRYYVKPLYSNVDPANEIEPAHALINARADLFSMVDRFLVTDFVEQKHMLLFADSGMGKTSFLLNYLNHNYRTLNFRKQRILLIPLSQRASDSMIESIPINDRARTNLFLDALDEDPRAMGNVQARIQQLLGLAEHFRTVIITCRSQFFRSDEQIPIQTGILKLGPVPLGQPKHYNFFRVYLAPFDDLQVKRYLRIRFPGLLGFSRRRRANRLVKSVPSLAVRPMLLAHMPDVLERNANIKYAVDVYQAMVDAWVQRESNWIEPESLKQFSEMLALALFGKRDSNDGETIDTSGIEELTRTLQIPVTSDLATSRSLLNRTSDGRYKFAHRSIMEFFVAESLLASRTTEETNLTDQMARFVLERLRCWSDQIALLVGNCGLSMKFVEPHKRLGLSTNYGLYRPMIHHIRMDQILRLRCAPTNGDTPALTLGELISDMSQTAFGVDISQVADIKLLIEESPTSRSSYVVRAAVWMNSYCAISEVNVPRSITDLLPVIDSERIPIMLSAAPALGTCELARADWTLSSRIDIPALGSETRLPQLPEGVALKFEETRNMLVLSILPEALESPSPLAIFGILSRPEDRSPVKDRPYGLIGPMRRGWAARPPHNSSAPD